MSTLNKFTQKKAVHLWPITVLRIYVGVFFLPSMALPKLVVASAETILKDLSAANWKVVLA